MFRHRPMDKGDAAGSWFWGLVCFGFAIGGFAAIANGEVGSGFLMIIVGGVFGLGFLGAGNEAWREQKKDKD